MPEPHEQEKALAEFLARHVRPYDPATDDYDRPPFAADVKEGKNDPIYNAHSYHTKVPPRGIIPYILHYTRPGDLILDPFCGSGMTGVAAQMCADPPADILEQFPDLKDRVGPRFAILNDLSPAACHIAYNYNTPVDVEALKREFELIKAAVEDEFDWLYGTEHYEPAEGLYDPANSEVWGRLKNPPAGGAKHTLLGDEERTWELITKAEVESRLGYPVTELPREKEWGDLDVAKVNRWICIPATIQYTIWSDVYRCEGFVTIEEPTGKVSTRGKNAGKPIVRKKKVQRGCGRELFLWDVAVDHSNGKVLKSIVCPHCGQQWSKRQIRLLRTEPAECSHKHQSLAKRSFATSRRRVGVKEMQRLNEIAEARCPYPSPTDRMPMGRQTRKTMSGKGIYSVDQYYSPRSRWALARLRHEMVGISDTSVASHLMWAFTAILIYASRMNRHNFGSQPTPLRGTFYVSSFVEEANVLRLLSGKMKTLERAWARLSEAVIPGGACAVVGNATRLPVEEGTVDYVLSDPPFGEALQYAELNFIWESWLASFTDLKSDCVINYVHGKDLQFYAHTMGAAFAEMHRALKPGRWASIVFKNTDDRVWEAIKQAATQAGFDLVNALEFDKQQRTFNQVNRAGAAGTDVVMNLFKPKMARARNGETEDGGGTEVLWVVIRDYLRALPDRIGADPGTHSELCRTTPVLHSVAIKGLLSQGLSLQGVTPEAVEAVCSRHLRRVGGKWYFHGEQVAGNGERALVSEPIEISDEPTAIAWLHQQLQRKPMTEGELNTAWKVATLRVSLDKTLGELLAESFWRDADSSRWREPTEDERERMDDDRSIRVLHDSERFAAGTLRRSTTDSERCEWVDVLFQACREVESSEGQAVPALRGFSAAEGYRLIGRLFQSILREKVPVAAFARAEKQARVTSQRIGQEIQAQEAEAKASRARKNGPTLFDQTGDQ